MDAAASLIFENRLSALRTKLNLLVAEHPDGSIYPYQLNVEHSHLIEASYLAKNVPPHPDTSKASLMALNGLCMLDRTPLESQGTSVAAATEPNITHLNLREPRTSGGWRSTGSSPPRSLQRCKSPPRR
eukprot:766984-Hanusia_phi.AAC.3